MNAAELQSFVADALMREATRVAELLRSAKQLDAVASQRAAWLTDALAAIGATAATPCGWPRDCSHFPDCGCSDPDRLPPRDASKPTTQQGLFAKYIVYRTDGTDGPGGKHENCDLFVLDVTHDPHAMQALAAYAAAAEPSHPKLARDMRTRYRLLAGSSAAIVRPYLTLPDRAWLNRIQDQMVDAQEYDAPVDVMRRLAQLGVVRRTSGNRYAMTSFGMHVLFGREGDKFWQLPLRTSAEENATADAEHEARKAGA